MLHPSYIAGWERRAFKVCGKALQPFTLGHARVLYIAESPLVVPGSPSASFEDVLLAVCVLSMAVAPAHCEIQLIADQAKTFQWADERGALEAFKSYLDYYCKNLPCFLEKGDEARTPWPWAYCSMLRRFYAYTEENAWKELCANAFWLGQAVAVQNGNRQYSTLAEMDTILMMEGMRDNA